MITLEEKQKINETIIKAMGYKLYIPLPREEWWAHSIEPSRSGTYRTGGYHLEICDFDPKSWKRFNSCTSVQDALKAASEIIGDKNASLTLYFNLPSNKYICNLDVNFNGTWEGRSDEEISEAISISLVEYIESKK